MRLLFVKGDKGLVANRDGLFYFPDRNSSIASEIFVLITYLQVMESPPL